MNTCVGSMWNGAFFYSRKTAKLGKKNNQMYLLKNLGVCAFA